LSFLWNNNISAEKTMMASQ